MGGNLNWVMRSEAGEVRKFKGWTNTLATGMLWPAFFRAEPAAITYAIEKISTGGEVPNALAPMEYGLVVVDFMTGQIFSRQLYTNLGRAIVFAQGFSDIEAHHRQLRSLDADGHVLGYNLETQRCDVADFMVKSGASVTSDDGFYRLSIPASLGYDRAVELWMEAKERFELSMPTGCAGIDDPRLQAYLAKLVKATEEQKLPAFFSIGQAEIGHGALSLRIFPDSNEGLQDMRVALVHAGFELTSAEQEIWDRASAYAAPDF